MNRLRVLILFIFIPVLVKAQTAGQVMFVGFNADVDDGFAFVALVDIPANTTIFFTDSEWNGSAIGGAGAFTGVEGYNSWSHTAVVSAGTVVTIANLDNSPALTASIGTAVVDGPTAMNLDNADEVLYMYLGTNRTTPTVFLSALANGGFGTNGTLNNTGLTAGMNATATTGDDDIMAYTGSTNCSATVAACAAAIADDDNWAGDGSNNGTLPDFPDDVPCDFFGTALYPVVTYYSAASGAWNSNTSWSLSADGSSGVVAAGVWPRRTDNVVIRSGHTITIDEIDDNKSCGVSPDDLPGTTVGPFTGSGTPMFYHIGDILINGTLTVTGIEMMTEGYTRATSGATFTLTSSLVNIGYLEVDAGVTLFRCQDDLVLDGYSTTIINTNSILTDDLIISHTNAVLCGTGSADLQNGTGSQITYVNPPGSGAHSHQICSSFRVTCSDNDCGSGFPVNGSGTYLLGNIGPGGVGNSTNNKLWLRANDLTLANSASVTSWPDASGNSLTATATGAAATRPTFNTNAVNTVLPAVSFDGGDFLNLGNVAGLNFIPRNNSWSFICAFNVATGSSGTFLSKATADADNRQYQYTIDSSTPNRYTAFIGGDFHTGAATATNAWRVGTSTTGTNATTGFNTYLNGTADLTGESVGDGSTPTTDVLIGARRNNTTTDFDFALTGRIAEIAMYNVVINDAQRIIINNYLAAKYGITGNASDVYTMDNTANGNYDFEVAGIGQVSTTNANYHRDAMGSGIVRMWNPSDLGNNEFLMWGHDGTVLYSSTTSGVAAPIEERLSRTWRVDKSGDVGTVSVSFDLSLLGTPLGSNLRLLIDRNGINGFADSDVTPIAGSFVGNTVVFSDVNFQDGDRFTLGNTDIDDPLPVELTNFEAQARQHMVYLRWTTASETNNDFFTVERSKNARDWEVVQQVRGAGTTQKINHYEAVDDGPYSGASYYRLKQTDFDLQSKYSDLVRVVVDHESPVILYPNPFCDRFRILIDFEPERSQVKLYSSGGIEIPFVMKKEGEELVIEPGNVPQGLYILKVLDRFITRTIKVVKVEP